jgi:hypothetical protein
MVRARASLSLRRAARAALALAGALVVSAAASASSVRELDLRALLAGSELVFEGRVVSREAVLDPGTKAIHTIVRFEITRVLKGESPDATIDLRFLGGSVGRRSLVVSDLHLPEPDETGIYFVESKSRSQVHPFQGWSQGHFVVRRDAKGRERVLSRAGVPITAVRAAPPAGQPRSLAPEVARGVTADPAAPLEAALELAPFEALLRQLAAEKP